MPAKLLLLSLLAMGPAQAATEFDNAPWDRLLHAHVRVQDGGQATQVDYAGMRADHPQLTAYIDSAAAVSQQTFDGWPAPDQLAFLINLYNAATVDLILAHYPDIDSIRDIGSLLRSPWSRAIVSLFGRQVSLDEIEHELIRGSGKYQEPRIHFAVNCAAIGCPPLRAEAYVGVRLEQQLEDNTRLFLADRSRNYVRDSRLYVSKIFDWYEEDFARGWQGIDSVPEFLLNYADALGLTAEQREGLRSGRLPLRYDRYDWGLNGTR